MFLFADNGESMSASWTLVDLVSVLSPQASRKKPLRQPNVEERAESEAWDRSAAQLVKNLCSFFPSGMPASYMLL
jgi:hypothetical protein